MVRDGADQETVGRGGTHCEPSAELGDRAVILSEEALVRGDCVQEPVEDRSQTEEALH